MLGGFRHGNGIMIWSDGAKFEGDWQYGFAHGQGSFLFPDGNLY